MVHFNTGIPLGYSLAAVFLLVAAAFGGNCYIWGCRKKSKLAKWFGGGIIFIVALPVTVEIISERHIEWNPVISNDSEIAGLWIEKDQSLTLAADKSFTYQAADRSATGSWSRDDWNLRLQGNNFKTAWRFIKYYGRYRLLTSATNDADLWNGDLGLGRK